MLHGVGTFVFQIETMKYLPAEAYQRYGLDDRATPADFIAARYQDDTLGHAADSAQWEQMFAVCEFSGDDLAGLRLYPIDLGHQRPHGPRPSDAGGPGSRRSGPCSGRAAIGEIRNPDRTSGGNWYRQGLRTRGRGIAAT
jgi:hypothetical protein